MKYTKPEINIHTFSVEDIVTASGTNTLILKDTGTPMTESYSSMFGGD